MWYDVFASLAAPAAVGVFLFVFERRQVKKDKQRETKEESRGKCMLLIINSVGASIALGEAAATVYKSYFMVGWTNTLRKMVIVPLFEYYI